MKTHKKPQIAYVDFIVATKKLRQVLLHHGKRSSKAHAKG